MTLPAYKASGAGSETSVAWPAGHAVGDFGLLFMAHPDTTISDPSGWTNILRVISNAASQRLSIWRRFATSTSEAAYTVAGSALWNFGTIQTFTGVNTRTPIHGPGAGWQGSIGGLQQQAGASTLIDDCMIVLAYSYQTDDAGPICSLPINSYLANLTERFDGGTITSDGGGLFIHTGELAVQGAFAPTTYTLSTGANPTAGATATIALVAADRTLAFQKKSKIINTRM